MTIPSPFFVGWVERYFIQRRCWVEASDRDRSPQPNLRIKAFFLKGEGIDMRDSLVLRANP